MAIEIYGRPVKIDLVRYTIQDFQHYRQARTHLTYSALKEGINMSGEPTGYGNQYPDTEPNNWPDIEQRFTNYQRQILAAENNLEAGLGYEEVGFHFQRSLENAMKGFLSYMEHDDGEGNAWMRSHSISELQEVVRTFPEGQAALGANDYTFLNDYAIEIPYEGGTRPPARRSGSPAQHHGNRRQHNPVHRTRLWNRAIQIPATRTTRLTLPGNRQPAYGLRQNCLERRFQAPEHFGAPRNTHAMGVLSLSCEAPAYEGMISNRPISRKNSTVTHHPGESTIPKSRQHARVLSDSLIPHFKLRHYR